jgi:hypothetical protein
MIERNERDCELIATGLTSLIDKNIQAVKLLMIEFNHHDPEGNGVKFLGDQLNTLGSEMAAYGREGVNFSEETLNRYCSVTGEIKAYLITGGRK